MSGFDAATLPSLVVVEGRRVGERIAIPDGRWIIGRDAGSDIVVDDAGVSRRHAALTVEGGEATIEDLGSTNGTRVNGVRLTSSHRLVAGDEVRMGAAAVRFETPPTAGTVPTPAAAGSPAAAPTPTAASAPAATLAPQRRRVRIWRVVLVGGLANLVLLAAGVVINFATDWTGIGAWLAAPLVGMVAALVDVGRQSLTREPVPASPHEGPTPAASVTGPVPPPLVGTGDGTRTKRRVPGGGGVGVAVLVGGGGGVARAAGPPPATAFITGNQTGPDRLVGGPVTVDTQGVTTTVHRVEHTQDFTRVEITVVNGLANTIALPVFGNATLASADGTTLGADPFRSGWNDTIAPGQTRSGVLVFPGHLGTGETTASLAFATVFEQGFDGPTSIVVDGLVLAPIDG